MRCWRYELTRFLNSERTVNFTDFDAAIWMGSRVCGLIPGRAARAEGAKVLLRAVDHWQQGNRFLAIAYAVVREFGDDEGNLFVVALGWYGFTAVYPLLLVVVTIFGYIGVESLGTGIVSTLHQFRVVGA